MLVIQTAKIGDLICSTPIFREIKKAYPDARLTAMVDPVTKELLDNNPHVDEAITTGASGCRGFMGKLRLSRLIQKGRYDVAICMNPNVPYTIAVFFGLVPVRLSIMSDFSGMTFRLASALYTHIEKHLRGKLVIETYLHMLTVIGIGSNDISLEIYPTEEADIKVQQVIGEANGRPIIGIAVSSGNKLKALGVESISRFVNQLVDTLDVYVALIGSAGDSDDARAIASSAAKKHRVIDATGTLSLKELPSLIRRLSLFISVDTGIAYMANALSIPIIHIPGPVNVSEQRPVGDNVFIVEQNPRCAPCTYVFKTVHACRKGTRECITSEDILSAALRVAQCVIHPKESE